MLRDKPTQPVQRQRPPPRPDSDPLAAVLLPPPDETPDARERRLRAEEEAKQRSENIDRMIRDSERHQRRKKVVKVLLLGQSESGKSTTLKQFQLLHTPAAFHAERIAWRFVIYLNLVRSIRRIIEAIMPEDAQGADDLDDFDSNETASIIITSNGCGPSNASHVPTSAYDGYRRRLSPLLPLEQRLIQQLSDPEDNEEQEPTHLPSPPLHSPSSFSMASTSTATLALSSSAPGRPAPRIMIPNGTVSSPTSPVSPSEELTVRVTSNWKKAFSALGKNQSPKSAHSGELQGWWEDPDDPVHIINRCAPVMSELWRDVRVRHRLAEKRLRLQESSGFFLDEIDRITAKMYFPTDEDVLKARLKTTGVVEHTFSLSKSSEFRGVDWKIYDVGGSRSQRHAWAPYFDDVNAIIFLAPISAFDQVLTEDPDTNRLEDTIFLWNSVVSNKLLANVNIVLFLNKCDLLKAKLQSGVKLKQHMTSYGDRPNDYDSVSKYFRHKFLALHQSFTPNKARELFIHMTSVTDTRKTHTIITNVRDIILTGNLRSSSLM
ncbi:Guanine nucleotide-binding protein alpha-4 subunit [Sparassis crispa]|uniref:Guanine nucleotide-binding protein alpha-4 subunit n=1 Tax=Sparassis crispa TaxID=139825 RepID=A0A401G594_9APHY|nr:Guanine nucleotide-binding protein alpha-4 subunit [Sparassis crispa]GBE77330.1 Guanine nucleotide-binding protein alpha-4 subunit [Sparassis crispa]